MDDLRGRYGQRDPTNLADAEPDDAIVYTVHFPGLEGSPEDRLLDLHARASQMLANAAVLARGHIWQKDTFQLVVVGDGPGGRAHLAGRTRVGDCVEDEWLIVWLLFELSKRFDGTVATVRDYDGEFLLIEAAAVLPAWVEPEAAENRVLIHAGRLHLIRPPRAPKEVGRYPSGKLELPAAIGHVLDGTLDTLAPAEVEAAVQQRISGYPAAVAENVHRARCFVPRRIAEILARNPQLVAPAVETFYTRDPISMRAASKLERFDPATSVPVTVRFSRMTYAMLVSQQFYPPKKFLPHIPPPSSGDHLAWQAGVKLACGFEMLASEPRWRRIEEQNPGWTVATHDFDGDPQWHSYRRALEARSFFASPGSDPSLLDALAKEQYVLHALSTLHSRAKTAADPVEVLRNPASEIARLLSLPDLPDEALNREPEDSDAWMSIDEAELEGLVAAKSVPLTAEDISATQEDDIVEGGSSSGSDADDEDEESAELEKLRKLVTGMSTFLERESGIDGVVFPEQTSDQEEDDGEGGLERRFEELMDEDSDDDEEEAAPSKSERRKKDGRGAPSLDADRFVSEVKRTLGFPMTSNPARQPDSDDESDFAPDDAVDGSVDGEIEGYMEAMDRELASTALANDFERTGPAEADANGELPPVNLDYNLVKNLLESFHAQEGLPGPATGLLGGLGVGNFKLPKEDDS
ncbi:SGT1 protein-domain-containing protein [Hyaloraphidium curvatum]|nr:SGT1 protein-domain-containing protein [Hyaloraphidium curvatum]